MRLSELVSKKEKIQSQVLVNDERLPGLGRVVADLLSDIETHQIDMTKIDIDDIMGLPEPQRTGMIHYLLTKYPDFKVQVHTEKASYSLGDSVIKVKCGDSVALATALTIINQSLEPSLSNMKDACPDCQKAKHPVNKKDK